MAWHAEVVPPDAHAGNARNWRVGLRPDRCSETIIRITACEKHPETMENITLILIIVVAIIISLVGVVGCVLPVLPGPLISFGAVLLVKFTTEIPVSQQLLMIFGTITLVVTIIDTILPLYMPKKFGSSGMGIFGATLGLIIGLFFPPVGFIVGAFIGALCGEFVKTKDTASSLVAGLGTFIGFMLGTVLKLGLSVTITGWLILKALLPAALSF